LCSEDSSFTSGEYNFDYSALYCCIFAQRTVEPEKQPIIANGSETTFVSRQREGSQRNRFSRQESARNSGDTVETVFLLWSVLRGYNEDNWSKNKAIWKRVSIQRGLEQESSGIANVRNVYQETTSEGTVG
jgi:hypothetical protein